MKLLCSAAGAHPAIRRRTRLTAAFVGVALLLSAATAVAADGTTASKAAPSVAPTTEVLVLPASGAAWTTSRRPSTPQNALAYVSATNSADRAFLKFNTATLAQNMVVSAELELRTRSSQATRPGVLIHPVSASWSSVTLTHRNRPAHQDIRLNKEAPRARAGQLLRIPLDVSRGVNTRGVSAFELAYSQPHVGTTYSTLDAGPKLRVTVVKPAPSTSPSPIGFAASDQLPYAVPAANMSSRKIFAHYFPPYPISLDNRPADEDYYKRNYLNPAGEASKFAQVGGLLRDRPEPRAPLSGNWKVQDLTTEVNQAADAGIDGFTVNVMSLSGRNWEATVNLMKAAAESGRNFTVVPNLDASSNAVNAPVETVAARLAELYRYPSAYKLNAHRYVLSSFKAEGKSVAWWKSLQAELAARHGIKVAFVAVLLDSRPANLQAYAPISYALGDWGMRDPMSLVARSDRAAVAHELGVKWMSAVAVQDVRPNQRLFAEAGNTEALRTSWGRAIEDGADLVQLVTWNDYSEGTSFAPSEAHDESFLDVNGYYLSRFKLGQYPKILRDGVYLTHRIHVVSAVPTYRHLLMNPWLGGARTPARDTVEVLTFLTQSADITVTTGASRTTFRAPAGLSTKLFPLAPGQVSATAVRSGVTISQAVSPYTVTNTPYVQDLQYYGSSSRSD